MAAMHNTKGREKTRQRRYFEKYLVRDFLEGLLVDDFIYTCGTSEDKRESMNIVERVSGGRSIPKAFLIWIRPMSAMDTVASSPASRWAIHGKKSAINHTNLISSTAPAPLHSAPATLLGLVESPPSPRSCTGSNAKSGNQRQQSSA